MTEKGTLFSATSRQSLWWIKPSNRIKETHQINEPNPKVETPSAEINSSIADFLDQERQCLTSAAGDRSDVDIKSILDEINRLAAETPILGDRFVIHDGGDRSVDDILKEAEKLVEESSESFRELCSSSKTSLDLKDYTSAKVRSKSVSKSSSSTALPKTPIQVPIEEDADTSISEDLGTLSVDHLPRSPEFQATVNGDEFQKETSSDKRSNNNLNSRKKVSPKTQRKNSSNSKSDHNKNKNNVEDNDNDNDSIKYNDAYELDFENDDILSDEDSITHENNNEIRDINLQLTYIENVGVKNVLRTNGDGGKLVRMSSVNSDRATSPIWPVTSLNKDRIALQESEERVKELQECLQAVRLQHTSLAESHRSLTAQHIELQGNNKSLQIEVQKLQEALNVSNEQVRRHLQTIEELRETTNSLQKQIQTERDSKKIAATQDEQHKRTIQDLQRQVREMERILARKHPDSVSALIVASKSPMPAIDDQTRKLLEERITQLENAAKIQNSKSQNVLQTVQDKFNNMQVKYEAHISDLESQVFNLQQIIMEFQKKEVNGNKASTDSAIQTDLEYVQTDKTCCVNASTQTNKIAVNKVVANKVQLKQNNMNLNFHKEDTHLITTIRGLNMELSVKEKSLQKMSRELEDCKKMLKRLQKDRGVNLKSLQDKPKEYDPLVFTSSPFSEEGNSPVSSRDYDMLQKDYHILVEKRLQDLSTLQHAHERELAGLEGTIEVLRGRLRERDSTISSLKNQIKAKVAALEKRHTDREKTLRTLVASLGSSRDGLGSIKM